MAVSKSNSVQSSSSLGELSPRRHNWLLTAVIFIIVAGIGLSLWRFLISRKAPGGFPMPMSVLVEMERLQASQLQDASEFVGTLDAQAGAVLQPEASGRITRIYVSSGTRVNAGDPIMELSPEKSQAELSAAQANMSASQAAKDNVAAQLRSLEAQRIRLEADVSLETSDFERIQALVTEGALSEQDLDSHRRDRDAAIASLQAAEQEIEAAQASLNQASANFSQAQANVTSTREDLLDKTVTAPISGIVGDIPVNLGDYVQPGSQLTTITQNESLALELSVPVEQANRMTLSMPVELLLFGESTAITTGAISFISPQTDADTQTVLAKARFSNTNLRLQDNQRVEARVIWDERPGVLVPATAITRLGGQTFVFVPGEPDPTTDAPTSANTDELGQVARLQPVTLGAMQGNNFQVLEGLVVGDTVITSGILNLQDGIPIMEKSDEAPESAGGPNPS